MPLFRGKTRQFVGRNEERRRPIADGVLHYRTLWYVKPLICVVPNRLLGFLATAFDGALGHDPHRIIENL